MRNKQRILAGSALLLIFGSVGYVLFHGGRADNVSRQASTPAYGKSPSGTSDAKTVADNNATATTPPASQTPAASTSTAQPSVTPAPKPGAYVSYSSSAVAATKGTKILFFHAPWCSQCRQLDASIRAGAVPSDVTIFKTDYDSNQELRKKYGVTIQTTLVKIDDQGNSVSKYVAYDEPTLKALIKHLLT